MYENDGGLLSPRDAYRLMLKDYPDVMDIGQMCEALGVSTKTGYKLLKDGKIEYLKIGRAYYLDSEVLNLFEVIKGHKIELVVLLTAFYGLRRSEVIGLKWSAFDFNHNCFSIRHTVTTCNVKGERVTIKKDKAKNKSSLRTYPLIPFLKERLLEAKKQQEENRKLCGRAYNKEYLGYVCVDVIGNLIKPNYVSSTFGKLLAKNNLRHIRFHDLRHTCASLLLANGVPMEQVKEWLGHSEISTTVDIYGHLQYATKKQSAAAIEQDIVAPMLQNLSAVSP
ncbi:MAG: tyrosine-type recombinase/integrase [Flavonifractor plautii]